MTRRAVRIAVGLGLLLGVVAAAPAQAPAPNPAQAPSVGDSIPEFEVIAAIDGQTRRIAFPKGSSTVLLFFLSGCPTCHKMLPEWNRAYERRPAGLRVVGVLMDQEPPGFFASTPIAFPVVRAPGRQWLQSLKVNRAPLTVRVAPGGKIADLQLGLVDPIRLGELFRR
jgi:hypothetical protein